MSEDPVYDACAAFVNELVSQGVGHAVISPGSRSTPLTLTLAETQGVKTWVRLDERSAAFFALGLAKSSGSPVVLLCTSGTAAANYLPAVSEANWSETPLIILTANRPPELRGWGAGQTIDQTNIYGSNVRWFTEVPVVTEPSSDWFQRTAARAVHLSTGLRPGPVHLDWPFREPLEPKPGRSASPQSTPIRLDHPIATLNPSDVKALTETFEQAPRGVVIAGPMLRGSCWTEAIHSFCRKTGYPLLAEPLSQLRTKSKDVAVINHHDHLLRSPWAETVVPEVVVRVGGPPTCKPLRLWLERHKSRLVMFDPSSSWAEPSFTVSDVVTTGHEGLMEIAESIKSPTTEHNWARSWELADQQATAAIDKVLDSEPLLQPAVARELGRQLPTGHVLYLSNSMPVRDADSFLEARSESLWVMGNRGASGIDGVISSAAGAAAAGHRTTLLIGDLAFQHDISGLLATLNDDLSLTIVVVDDQGGGIFKHLPISQATDATLFKEFFTTPQHLPIREISEALKIDYFEVTEISKLAELLRKPQRLRVIRIPVDPDLDLDQHRRLTEAVTHAVSAL
ncbi:MAG: 2-succinyl-5-enolpyruvyl-6-hydroxy-3-cyclohexene-1-carboxylic-acid synthase [Actinomycetota bacterium]|nr:2-succinyl-5-enolpyruvyl-6-hydroxy-3-cyclohexene-1-carboxylic-acid synthase [Actinomycetota bacterium]